MLLTASGVYNAFDFVSGVLRVPVEHDPTAYRWHPKLLETFTERQNGYSVIISLYQMPS